MIQASPNSYSVTVRMRYVNDRGMLGKITTTIGDADGMIGAVDIVNSKGGKITRDFTINASNDEHGATIVKALAKIEGAEVVTASD